jgi:polyhydroxybutyrate depolymerase
MTSIKSGLMAALVAFAISLAMGGRPALAQECGQGGTCAVEGDYYRAAAPPQWDGKSPLPVVVYFHGWNASPEGTFRNRAMVNAVHQRGALFVAPYAQTGYWRQIGEDRAEGGRDEAAFIRAVMDDVKRRWPIDEKRSLASGFSRGASMVWNVACYVGDLFAGYAPIAGGFWGSTPPDCPSGPVNLRHIHGLKDRVVSFDKIGTYDSMPIVEGFALLRGVNGCPPTVTRKIMFKRYACEAWSDCSSGRELQLCLHPKGHSIPAEWVAEGLDWILALARADEGTLRVAPRQPIDSLIDTCPNMLLRNL